jgi:hypothetical protein
LPNYGQVTKLGKHGAVMPPQARFSQLFYLIHDDIMSIEWGKHALYVFGFVKYRDAFGSKHETRYCYRFKVALGVSDPASRNFYLAGPPEYNKAT